MENGIEHELQLRTARAQHGVKAGIHPGEGGLRLLLHDPDRHQQPAGQRNQRRGDGGRERVLAQALENDGANGHAGTSAQGAVRLCGNRWTFSNWPEHLAVVTDEQQRRAVFAARFADEGQRFAGVLVVEIAGRLVRQTPAWV